MEISTEVADFITATNSTSNLSSECVPSRGGPIHLPVACLFFLLFPVALLFNGVAAWVSLHLRSTSTFIVYLKNLVAADLLMTLTLPLMAASTLPGASVRLKVFACRCSDVIFYSCLYTGIMFMGLISLDRYFKIVRPRGKVLGQNLTFSLVTSTLVWVLIFGSTTIPSIVLTNREPVNETGDFCMSLKGPPGRTLHMFVVLFMEMTFWLVSVLIVFCYICITLKVLESFRNSGSNNGQGKKKTKLRVFLVLLVFFVCFVPLHTIRIPFTLNELFNVHVCTETWMTMAHDLVLWVSTTNACLDPLLYVYLCREYRDKLVTMVKAGGLCVGLYPCENEDVSQGKSDSQ